MIQRLSVNKDTKIVFLRLIHGDNVIERTIDLNILPISLFELENTMTKSEATVTIDYIIITCMCLGLEDDAMTIIALSNMLKGAWINENLHDF